MTPDWSILVTKLNIWIRAYGYPNSTNKTKLQGYPWIDYKIEKPAKSVDSIFYQFEIKRKMFEMYVNFC